MQLKNLKEVSYHPISEKLVSMLRQQNQNLISDTYFRGLSSFYLCQVASTMRASVKTETLGTIPVNMYTFCTAPSGLGKTKSVNILEQQVLKGFYHNFKEYTLPMVAEKRLEEEALKKCQLNGTDFEEELSAVKKEYDSLGEFVFDFSKGSDPAYRQIRTKCQIPNIGSTNYIIDEIGHNLLEAGELFKTHFEVYDVGLVKGKITKAGSDNKRYKERVGAVPANMLAFGTPDKIYDGAKIEEELDSLIDSGYGRRFLCGIGKTQDVDEDVDVEELYDTMVKSSSKEDITDLIDLFTNLSDEANLHRIIPLERAEALILLQYQLNCKKESKKYPKHKNYLKTEMQHRYFRVLKLAGAYAFVDTTPNVTEDQLYAAIKLVEAAGEAFAEIMNQPKNYVRLAQYLAATDMESTLADIAEDLSFFPSAKNKQEELLSLAISWGYRNNVIIKRSLMDGIEFFSGESLAETDLDQLLISYTHAVSEQDSAYGYMNKELKWDQIHQLCQAPHYHWLNHHLTDGHRQDESIMAGSNLLVLDLDGGTSLTTAKTLLEGYKAYIYTTKRHTEVEHRFRIVMPLKYTLKLSKADYKEFVNNIREFLPFDTDECSNQRSKKWLCHKGHEEYVEGDLFDPLPFIPKTKKNTQRQADARALGNMDKVEQYFAKLWNNGRNNTLLRYGTMLLDSGLDLYATQQQVIAFNNKFSDPLGTDELNNSVFKTLSKKVTPDV